MEISNVEGSVQIVLSGEKEKIRQATEIAPELMRGTTMTLNVAEAFHISLLEPACIQFVEFLQGKYFQIPRMKGVSNVTG
jgi:acyl transferase domain-containing protein